MEIRRPSQRRYSASPICSASSSCRASANWKDLRFFRPSKDARYRHIDNLFSDTIDWDLIETHWQDLLQVVLSIKAGTVSSALLLRRLGTYSRRNRLYLAFSELGRVIRTAFLLEYVSSAQLREQITASTNKVEAYHRFAKWLFFGGEGLLLEVHPDEQEKRLKVQPPPDERRGHPERYRPHASGAPVDRRRLPVNREDLAALSPHQTRHIKRFGDYVLTVTAPKPFDADLITPFPLEAVSEEQSASA